MATQRSDGPLGQAATKSSLCYQGGSTDKRRTRYKYFLQIELRDVTSLKVLDNLARAGHWCYFSRTCVAPKISHHIYKLKVSIFPKTSINYIKRLEQSPQPGTYQNQATQNTDTCWLSHPAANSRAAPDRLPTLRWREVVHPGGVLGFG